MKNIAVIGLGCVGLPLAVAYGEKRPVVGFDINSKRIAELRRGEDFGCQVDVTDCWADPAEAEHEYGLSLVATPEQGKYDAVFLAVPHNAYAAMSAADLRGYAHENGVLFDLKGVLGLGEADLRL